jgi:hypothetical protein
VLQFALSMTLLVGAALLVRSVINLRNTDLGFATNVYGAPIAIVVNETMARRNWPGPRANPLELLDGDAVEAARAAGLLDGPEEAKSGIPAAIGSVLALLARAPGPAARVRSV